MMDMKDRMRMENEQKATRYKQLNQVARKGQIVMTGSSLMEQFPVTEFSMTMGKVIYNRGFGGFITTELMEVLDDCVLALEPSKLFINIGTNDLDFAENALENLLIHYREILEHIQHTLPSCQIIMLAYYPVCQDSKGFTPPAGKRIRTKEVVDEANIAVKALAEELGCQFVNVNSAIETEDGYLKPEYASDLIHMWPSAYVKIMEALQPWL